MKVYVLKAMAISNLNLKIQEPYFQATGQKFDKGKTDTYCMRLKMVTVATVPSGTFFWRHISNID
jgi:hypothetical protein